MFSDRGRVCVFVIDGKDHNQQHDDDRMERSEAKLHFRYQKLNSISEFWIPGVGSVETLHHRNAEMRNTEIPKGTHVTWFWEFLFQIPVVGGVKSRDSSSQESESCEMRNTKILKQAHQQRIHFGVLQTGKSKIKGTLTFEVANPEISKQTRRRPVKFQNHDKI